MSENEKAPIHPFEVRISIGADEWDYVIRQLRELLDMAETRTAESMQSFGGGAGGCYSVTTATRDISPAAYREELSAWFDHQK